MGCEALPLITKGYLVCPTAKIINRIVSPINICIKTKDICLNFKEPVNTQLFLKEQGNIKICPVINTFKLSIKKLENLKLNIRKCKES